MVETASSTSTEQKYVTMLAESSSQSSDALFGRKLLFLLGLILVAFCPTGSLAKFVFNLFATLPMAYFSLKVLLSSRVSPDSYQSVVLYWFVYGVFLFLDMVCAQSFGYKLFKICVLLFVAHYVTECNTRVFNEIIGNDGAMTTRKITRKSVRSIRSLSFDSRSPTCKDFAPTVSSHCTGIRSDLLSSGERSMPFSENQWDLSPAILRSINKRSARATSSEMVAGLDSSLIVDDEDVFSGQAKGHGTRKSSSHIESKSTFSIGNGDIVISSLDRIELLSNGVHLLIVVNSSTENIMWALKSNALQYLAVAPACGVIVSGAVVTIQLVRRENAPIRSKTEHQLAIDYALVGSVREYTSLFVNKCDKKEHLWTVKFN